MAKKEHMNIVFIGHVDSGKSTSVGRILYDTGALPENVLRKLKEEAERVGKVTFEYAFVMDTLKEERERGVTIEVSHKEFETPKYHFTIIDDQMIPAVLLPLFKNSVAISWQFPVVNTSIIWMSRIICVIQTIFIEKIARRIL